MITVLRPLSTSELLDRTFHLYRNHFLVFISTSALPQILVLPLTLGGAAFQMRRNFLWAPILTMAGYFLFFVVFLLSQAPIVVAVSNLQMQKPVGIGSSFSGARESFLRVLWIVFLLSLISAGIWGGGGTAIGIAIGMITAVSPNYVSITAGLVLTLVPSYFLLRWMLGWALAIPVTVLEGGWFLASLRRSMRLSKGTKWRIFVIYILVGILAFVISTLVEFLVMFGVALLQIRNPRLVGGILLAVWAIGIFVSTSLVGALATIAMTLVYYDQRVRKEAFDLQLMMATLQSKPEAAVGNVKLAE